MDIAGIRISIVIYNLHNRQNYCEHKDNHKFSSKLHHILIDY